MYRDKKNDWLYFSQSYLYLAKLGCQELLKPNHKKIEGRRGINYSIQDLVIPIIFNTKHGIEIFTKTLNLMLCNNYNNNEHDIKLLFNELKKQITVAINKKIMPGIFRQDTITQKDIDEMPNNINELEAIINDFYHLNFINNKINNNLILCDIKNDVLRYPENGAKILIDWDYTLTQFIKKDIIEYIEKIKKLSILFNKIGYMIDVNLNTK